MPEIFDISLSPHLVALVLVIGYCLGSIPFGLILTRLAGLGDVRAIGSGNIGATNVLRTGRKGIAAATLAADILKGAAAVFAGSYWGENTALIAGFAAFLGHLFPIWLKFKGGKGVATYIGVLLGLSWPVCLIFCGTWLVVAYVTRYSSLSALAAAAAAPLALAAFELWPILLVVGIMTALLFIRHHANISRLLAGTESKIGAEA